MFIKLDGVSHKYSAEAEDYALKDVTCTIKENEFVGLVGHTGSGKSTLVQTLNGLIEPTEGSVVIDGLEVTGAQNLQQIRQQVGLVFQYPEHQLFEETVFEDIAFGPRNLGLADDEVTRRVKQALKLVNLDYNEFKDRFEIILEPLPLLLVFSGKYI